VGDLDGEAKGKRNWSAKVTAYVHDGDENLIDGATVSGYWNGDHADMSSCVTNRKGKCSVQSPRLSLEDMSITFIVDNVVHDTLSYEDTANHDPDDDSDGTSIALSK
jgi:hypothetical protein